MKKYGLQLRIPPQQQKAKPAATKPTLPPAAIGFGDDDDDNVEQEIARHAAKNRALKEVEETHKKALEEDPSVFDYDGVYDEMKLKVARPIIQDQKERKPKYIEKLLEKAKERKMEQDIIYERKLVKERSKEDHLFGDKEKFVTGAYRKKLEEQEKWKEEERRRQLREEREDVTKGSVTDFYFSLERNVAFGAAKAEDRKPKQEETTKALAVDGGYSPEDGEPSAPKAKVHNIDHSKAVVQREDSAKATDAAQMSAGTTSTAAEETTTTEQAQMEQIMEKSYKRGQDAVSAAKERYLARKRSREQQILQSL